MRFAVWVDAEVRYSADEPQRFLVLRPRYDVDAAGMGEAAMKAVKEFKAEFLSRRGMKLFGGITVRIEKDPRPDVALVQGEEP